MGSRRHRSPRRARRSHGPRGHERVNGHAATRQSVLVRPVIAPYLRQIVDPPRLKFLSRAADSDHAMRRVTSALARLRSRLLF
jgi:hypothetical protein